MTKFFAFDLDGTLLRHDKDAISDANIAALTQAKNKQHILAIATGRPFADVKDVIEDHNNLFNYVICNNGTYHFDTTTNKFHIENTVDKKVFHEAVKIGTKFNTFLAAHTVKQAYRSKLGPIQEGWVDKLSGKKSFILTDINEVTAKIMNEDLTQVSLRSYPENIAKVAKEFDHLKHLIDIHIVSGVYLDFNPIGCSKFSAIEKIINKLNIPIDNVYAFGDSGNDIQMLTHAGMSFAMGNAAEEVKNVAKKTIGSNETNAIAETIMELI